ncbi:MAG: hypothetical protein WCL27_11525, partial [Betaproteobacteria bacterium]
MAGYDLENKTETVIEKTERGIAWTAPDGKRRTFEVPIRTFYIQARTLKRQHVLQSTENDYKDLPLKVSLRCEAVLDDRSIEVLSNPETKSKAIDLSFQPLRSDVATDYPRAMMSFNSADWEIGDDDTWWVSVYLAESQFNQLLEACDSKQVAELVL